MFATSFVFGLARGVDLRLFVIIQFFFFSTLYAIQNEIVCTISKKQVFSYAEQVVQRTIDGQDPLASRTILYAIDLLRNCEKDGWVMISEKLVTYSACSSSFTERDVSAKVGNELGSRLGEVISASNCEIRAYPSANLIVLLFHLLVCCSLCLQRRRER